MPVYLLHFSPSYKHAAHYLGYAEDVAPRVYAHVHGRGARLTQVATEAGCDIILVRVWDEATRATERRFKNNSHSPRLCPICNGLGVQLPLLVGEPAYVAPKWAIDSVTYTAAEDRYPAKGQLALTVQL